MSILDSHVRIRVVNAPDYYYREIQTDTVDDTIVDPAFPARPVADFAIEEQRPNVPTAVPTGLDITADVGSAIVADVTSIVADPDDTKFCLVSVIRDDITSLLEIQVQEKVLGNYGDTPAGKTWECDIAEFFVVAAGTTLVVV